MRTLTMSAVSVSTAAVLVTAGIATAGGAHAASTDGPDYEMPFPCADTWTGSSRDNHSPSSLAIDWNRANDDGAMIASAPGVVSRHRVSFRMGSRLASQSCPDVPMQAGHWKQTGRDYPAVFRRSATTATFLLRAPGGRLRLSFGRPTDEPVSGDWDGDGVTDVGVRRPGWKAFVLTARNGSSTQVALGRVRDTGVTGDWDGDGATDVGVWHPATATFTLRTQSTSGAVRLATVQLGASSDLPTTGDWNGDGVSDLAVWSPSTRVYRLRTTPTSTVPSTTTTTGMGLARG